MIKKKARLSHIIKEKDAREIAGLLAWGKDIGRR